MNKRDVITKVSEISKVETDDCEKVIDALEQVFNDELSSSKGKGNAFDKVYRLMGVFKSKSLLLLICLALPLSTFAQKSQLTQTIRGTVVDQSSGAPLAFATVGLSELAETGAFTDADGQFVLSNVPIGRYTIKAILTGYESTIIQEILLTSAKEVNLQISLKQSVYELGEIVVAPKTNKNEALNKMALTGGHMLRVEEASRYAGGMDDPARLVSTFAGISPSVGNNGISIHGNAPSLLQWRLEDIEIPNPNHFADIATLGGGILSSLSSNVLGNSDFFTGAFSAEYNNAVSGVFDMKLRNGNNQKFENTVQLGILGLDFASEGPFSRKNNSSYIFNYRYSTTGLAAKLSPSSMGGEVLDYQDLNFKLNFPTKKAGVFSLWGTALIDKADAELDEVKDWKYQNDSEVSVIKQTSAAVGLSHRYFFSNNSMLKTSIAATYAQNDAWGDQFDTLKNSTPSFDMLTKNTNLVFNTSLNHKFGARHTNKTGVTVTNMRYNMNMELAPLIANPMETIMSGNGNTNLISAYTSSLISVSDRLTLTLGVNGQFLTLNNNWTIEPRASVKWQASSKSSFALAYGLHSRMEKMDVYFVKTKTTGAKLVNKELDFTKTHHVMLSYSYRISDNMNLRIEPYFQSLYDVPVVADSSYSILNRNDFYVEDALVNRGKGRNFGVDITFEKYLTKGLYYMVTASLFDSKYKGGDGEWHNTRYNRNFIVNGLIGKEWRMGRNRQNTLGINLRLTIQGGDRYSPVDVAATMAHPDKKVQYDQSKAYSKQFSPMVLGNYAISFKMNRKKVSHEFSVKSLNATGYKEYSGHEYNMQTGVIEPNRVSIPIINASYKFNF